MGILKSFQVSYLIIDQAEEDAEVVVDPFLDAGITVPTDLPYQTKPAEIMSEKERKEEKRISKSNMTENEDAILMDTINIANTN